MSALIEPSPAPAAPGDEAGPARRLRAEMAASRVQFAWFGARKALRPDQRDHAAAAFDAQAPYISASKKLIDTSHESWRAVTAVRHAAVEAWRA